MKESSSLKTRGLVAEIDALIVAGQTEYASARLVAVPWKEIPKPELVDYARLARRLHMPELALSLLYPLVRSSVKGAENACASESAEYAASLIQIGALKEAEQILGQLGDAAPNETQFFQGAARVACWDYRSAIGYFNRYLESPSLSDYERAIGEINLGAALVHEGEDHAAEFLTDFLNRSTGKGYQRLRGRAWLLLVEWATYRSRWEEADRALAEVAAVFRGINTVEDLFVKKWRAITNLARRRDETGATELRSVKAEAEKLRHWETFRDCDFHLVLYLGNREMFLHLYFGTPFPHYRERLVKMSDPGGSLPDTYEWKIGPNSSDAERLIHLFDGSLDLKPGSLLHSLLATLCTDFYRPIRIADLHDRLYPGEYFNPESSPSRVHQALHRLRRWFEGAGVPLVIEEFKETYSLGAEKPCRMLVRRLMPEGGRPGAFVEKLCSRLPAGSPFTVSQVSLALGLPLKTTQREIKAACDEGRVRREGSRRLARYWLV